MCNCNCAHIHAKQQEKYWRSHQFIGVHFTPVGRTQGKGVAGDKTKTENPFPLPIELELLQLSSLEPSETQNRGGDTRSLWLLVWMAVLTPSLMQLEPEEHTHPFSSRHPGASTLKIWLHCTTDPGFVFSFGSWLSAVNPWLTYLFVLSSHLLSHLWKLSLVESHQVHRYSCRVCLPETRLDF